MNDNTILRIKVPAHLYESVKEQLTINEAKKANHHYGAGMEEVKEKKVKMPKDGMKKVEEKKEIEAEAEAKVEKAKHIPVKTVADLSNMMKGIAMKLRLMKGIQTTEITAIGELLQSILDKVQSGDITSAGVKADRAFDIATQNIKPAQKEEAKVEEKKEEEE